MNESNVSSVRNYLNTWSPYDEAVTRDYGTVRKYSLAGGGMSLSEDFGGLLCLTYSTLTASWFLKM